MIKPEKIFPAFAALQELFISARWKVGKGEKSEAIYDLLDGAEYLAGMASEAEDKTDSFEQYLEMLCERHSCHQALRAFREHR
jgi:hypothetical protein